jgi:hypothetical protein
MQGTIEGVSITGTSSSNLSGVSGPSIKWNNAFLAAVLLVGTGGLANLQPTTYVPSGSLMCVRGTTRSAGKIDSPRLLDAQEKLAGIQRYLSMNVTDLAKVLRVGRPTVYSWLRDEALLRGDHAQRVEMVYGLARKWRMISSRPVGSFLKQPLASGETPLSLLSAKTLDEFEIQAAFADIQAALTRTIRRQSVAGVAKQRGFKLATTHPQTSWSSGEDLDV